VDSHRASFWLFSKATTTVPSGHALVVGPSHVLCASNGGSPTHPGWYHNLSAIGRAEIQVGPEHLAVRARTADPAERSRLFPRFVQMYKGYGAYEHTTSRQIPLVLLTPDRPIPTT
jgi:deazaflavin-dependent oxidoreductase (nitroreductase family)